MSDLRTSQTPQTERMSERIEKSAGCQVTPLNLDLTCLQVNSSLEESLATANQVLQLVQSLEPNIITIQCHVTEDSLDYLLFNKLPGNSYDKKYVRSSGRNNTGHHEVQRLMVMSCQDVT